MRGVPPSNPNGGYPEVLPPIMTWEGGTPCPDLEWVPPPVLTWKGGTPHPHPDLGRGYCCCSDMGGGYPPPKSGGWGIPRKCGQTENITFPHPSDAGGKKSNELTFIGGSFPYCTGSIYDQCERQGVNITDAEKGIIRSERYPSMYPSNRFCIWRIQVRPFPISKPFLVFGRIIRGIPIQTTSHLPQTNNIQSQRVKCSFLCSKDKGQGPFQCLYSCGLGEISQEK